MKVPGDVYLVGGAVRDQLLGRTVEERDWLVVGSSESEMLEAGFKRVGKSFPVFLHPHTHEEYALARIESKVGKGHKGFEFDTSPSVSLEDDLSRRDLTINAMAIDSEGELIDPFGGKEDIESRVLRHVSNHFSEDPLRCFRVARFACTLWDFEVDTTTVELMNQMQPQLGELSAPRVYGELKKAMSQEIPARFFKVIQDARIEDPWFAGLDLDRIRKGLANSGSTEFGDLRLGWILDEHEVRDLLARLEVPKRLFKIALVVSKYGRKLLEFTSLKPGDLLQLLEDTYCFRDPHAFDDVLRAVKDCSGTDLSVLSGLALSLRALKLAEAEGREHGEKLGEIRMQFIEMFQRVGRL